MSLFNDTLKNISLKPVFSLIVVLFIIQFSLNSLNVVQINSVYIYLCVIFYFIWKFRHCISSAKNDFFDSFSKNNTKIISFVVILNIFLSYGLLYLSDFLLANFSILNILVEFPISSIYLNYSLIVTNFIATVIISPISEELIFRGVLFNKLKLIVPTVMSILITSLLFAALHGFGNITSAFIFALCMSILYIKTENIFVPIVAHFLNNFIAESIVILDSGNLLFTNTLVMGVISFLSVVSAILILRFIVNNLNNIK